MKRILPVILIFPLLILSESKAQTTISSGAKVFGAWKKSSSPYYVKGNISVPKDSTLSIEPGVQVRFDGKYIMTVYGNIRAIGKEGDSIRFYPQDTANRWRGLRYIGQSRVGDSAIFRFCKFEYVGPKLVDVETALRLTRGNFIVEHCKFSFNAANLGGSAFFSDSVLSLQLKNCYFYRNTCVNSNSSLTYGVSGPVGIAGSASIEECVFEKNVTRNPYYTLDKYSVNCDGSGGTIYLTDYSNKSARVRIDNCQFIENYSANKGAAVFIYYLNQGHVRISNTLFRKNFSGRFGAVTFGPLGSAGTKSNVKIVIEACHFDGNRAANSTTYSEASSIGIHKFSTTDSLIIKGNLFEKNISGHAVYLLARVGDKDFYLLNNVFRNNYSGCVLAQGESEVYSIGNLYHHNLQSNYLLGKTPNSQFYSINDLYAFNGYKVDTLWLDQQLMQTFAGNYYKFSGGVENEATTAGVFRNCIFWGNRMIDGSLVHLRGSDVRFQELSNCIMDGNTDSTIAWVSDVNAGKPTTMVINKQNIIAKSPMFLNSSSDFGPDVNTQSFDFHLKNTCSELSPAYNAGLNNALAGWSALTDMDGENRIICDTVDIGPYELGARKSTVKITSEPKDTAMCSGASFALKVNNSCASNISYQWQKRSAGIWSDINNANQETYVSLAPDTGYFRVLVKSADCNVSDTGRIVHVWQRPSPKPFLGKDTSIKDNKTLILNPGTFSSYLWQDGSSGNNFSINGNTAGLGTKSYHVTVKNQYNCSGSDTINVTVEKNSSLLSLQSKGWKLYPNPSNGIINIESPDSEVFIWQLMDISGTQIQTGDEHSALNIDLRTFPSGTYMIRIQTQSGAETVKILKAE